MKIIRAGESITEPTHIPTAALNQARVRTVPPITTDETLAHDLRKSVAARKSIQTVGDFLNALMAHGLTLDTPLSSVEFGIAMGGNGRLVIEDVDGAIDIREGRA